MGLQQKIAGLENFKAIQDYIPSDNSSRQNPLAYVRDLYGREQLLGKVLDLGCGEGNSIDLFHEHTPQLEWHGVDIEGSPEANRRQREDGRFKSFDGINLPYADNTFSTIYCNQVLEHVRHPDQLMPEALRVLTPSGYFIGAVSYLEPFHSYSVFNFTPYGVKQVFEDAGFRLLEMRHGVDASHLINRQLLNRSARLQFLWRRSYLYAYVRLISLLFRLDTKSQNFLKLMFAGHIVFLAQKPEQETPSMPKLPATPPNPAVREL